MKKKSITRDVKFLGDKAWNDEVDGKISNHPFVHAFELVDTIGEHDPIHICPQLQVQFEPSKQGGQPKHCPSSSNKLDNTLA